MEWYKKCRDAGVETLEAELVKRQAALDEDFASRVMQPILRLGMPCLVGAPGEALCDGRPFEKAEDARAAALGMGGDVVVARPLPAGARADVEFVDGAVSAEDEGGLNATALEVARAAVGSADGVVSLWRCADGRVLVVGVR